MTPNELHALMEPCREAMVKDGIWPTRDDEELLYFGGEWCWFEQRNGRYRVNAHSDDAHNAFLAALLVWALASVRILAYNPDGYTVRKRGDATGTNAYAAPIHALVSAYRQAKGIK